MDASQPFQNTQLPIDNLPQWQEIQFEALDKAAPWVTFWQSCIGLLIMSVFAANAYWIQSLPTWIPIGMQTLIIVWFGLSQWYNFAEHKKRGVALREKDIAFRKGLFWQQNTLLPLNKVQHIEIHRNPIERKLGLSSMRIFTAGGSGVDLQISGLKNETAETIKHYILEKTDSESVGK